MSTPVQLKITKAGIESVFDAEQRGLRLQLNRIVYSSANFESVNMDTRTQLGDIIFESTIAAGGVSEDRQTLRFFSVINSSSELEVKSLGIYTDTNVLFAIASAPAGNLFKVYNGVSFIASFGLALAASTSSAINIVTDQNAAMALILMNDHESALNPHPQYMAAFEQMESITEDIEQSLQELQQAQESAGNQIQEQLQQAILQFQQEIEALSNTLNSVFPKVIMAGVIKPGQALQINRPIGSSINFQDDRYVVHVTPEGGHEAWGIARQQDKININIWSRSGTNRIGYSGNTSWMIVQLY